MKSLKMFIKQAEDIRKQPPTEKDIAEVEVLLRDFGLSTPIPKFKTVTELDKWRRAILLNN